MLLIRSQWISGGEEGDDARLERCISPGSSVDTGYHKHVLEPSRFDERLERDKMVRLASLDDGRTREHERDCLILVHLDTHAQTRICPRTGLVSAYTIDSTDGGDVISQSKVSYDLQLERVDE